VQKAWGLSSTLREGHGRKGGVDVDGICSGSQEECTRGGEKGEGKRAREAKGVREIWGGYSAHER